MRDCEWLKKKWQMKSENQQEQITFDKMMMMMSALYKNNTLSLIFIMITHGHNSPRG